MVKYCYPVTSRILTDDMTGRSDRVAVEWEAESIAVMNAQLESIMSKPESQAEMAPWTEKLATLIEYAEGENWVVR
ncbi:MAG: hypothetical protein IIC33_05285 [Chloroflexi bacterium]|nr:hypothetical protein [Chloroflexota bacterium]